MIALLTSLALATPSFDPAAPAMRNTDTFTTTQDGATKLWSAIERWEDPDRELFTQESFNRMTAWKDLDASPHIASAFDTSTPHSSQFLLHVGVNEEISNGTPILMVHGAGDNGSRAFVTLGTKLDRLLRPVYALTFAHPHGDVFQQAETVANAIAVIKQRTGSDQVDVIAHSKGGVAATLYAAHTDTVNWGNAGYQSVGTPYRGDIRRLVLVATPLGGIDTAYRWPAGNYFGLDSELAVAPTSWSTYYPYSTAQPTVREDLRPQDFLPGGGDLFPGQRQILRRQPYDLPGSLSWLGGYALQPDWFSTYEGGLGFSSDSEGIDAAILAGDQFMERLRAQGIDPSIPVYLLAGSSPLMPNGDESFAELWDGVASRSQWASLIEDLNEHDVPVTASEAEIQGLADGQLILGEVSGPSDGVVFVSSSTDAGALNARGAQIAETYVADLSHIDLLYASPITGQLLIDGADPAAGTGWMAATGQRYIEADSLGWIVDAVYDPNAEPPEDTGLDTGAPLDGPTTADRPCGGCSTDPVGPGSLLLPLMALFATRRRR